MLLTYIMALIVAGESVWFSQWETDQYVEYNALCRVPSGDDSNGDMNLSWFDEDGIESQANNILNEEDSGLGSTDSYWRKRYANINNRLAALKNEELETIRVEKGGMVIWRPWVLEAWAGAFMGVVVATLGAPSAPHPRINLKYVNSSGTTITEAAVDCVEQYTDEIDAHGNDLWSNLPSWVDGK